MAISHHGQRESPTVGEGFQASYSFLGVSRLATLCSRMSLWSDLAGVFLGVVIGLSVDPPYAEAVYLC